MNRFSIIILTFCLGLYITACSKFETGEVLEYNKNYLDINDANNAVLGLYGKVMELAGPVVVLNELRGDLMDITFNATQDLQDINQSKPVKGNKWSNVTPFYTVIQNCNDILFNFAKMKSESRLTDDDYKELYSDVMTIRCWVYLQLGLHFNDIPYITEPIVKVSEIESKSSVRLKYNQLLDSLIYSMENVPSLEPYTYTNLLEWYLDGYDLEPFFINKKCLLGDLYLYRSNPAKNDYVNAATMYRDVLATDEESSNARKYRMFTWVTGTSVSLGFQIAYTRYKDDDASSFINTYRNMFLNSADNTLVREEMIWEMTYDYKYAPEYPFIELFANFGSGKYYLKPSQFAIDSLWNNQLQNNNFNFDGRGLTTAFDYNNGQPLVMKYLYDYMYSTTSLQKQGKWFLYRAGMLHLRYAEASNRAGYPDLALALLNNGVRAYYNWNTYPGTNIPVRLDSTRISGKGPGNYYPEPFYFDARQSDQPYVRAPWRDGSGVRGRVSLRPIVVPASVLTLQDSIDFVEEAIINEEALEYGLEGQRWGDLVRFAHRWNNDTPGKGSTFLNQAVGRKFKLSGLTAPDYTLEDNWYLPVDFD